MRIQILGTAAAEGWPAVFCGCETCARARAAGGKDIRTRASVLVDGVHKIDLPPDTHYHSFKHGIEFSKLQTLLITHSHEDHFALGEMIYFKKPFAHNLAHSPIKLHANQAVLDLLESRWASDNLPLETHLAQAYAPINAGALRFTPIPAHHKLDEQALNYVVTSPEATVLYASDTGPYDEPTLGHLKNYSFDMLIIECTQGMLGTPAVCHMEWQAVLDLRDILDKAGSLKPDVRTVITHFSHNIGMLHHEIEAIASPEKVEVAYDGVSFDV